MRIFCILIAAIAAFLVIAYESKKQPENSSNTFELPSKDFHALSTLMMANEYYEQDNYKEAAKGFELTVNLDSTIGEAHYKLAYSLARLESDTMYITTHPSIKHFIKAAELNYRPAEAYHNAAVYKSIFAFDDSTAIDLFKKSLEINPDQPAVYEMIEDAKQRLKNKSGIQKSENVM